VIHEISGLEERSNFSSAPGSCTFGKSGPTNGRTAKQIALSNPYPYLPVLANPKMKKMGKLLFRSFP
jgi:hypothetical protein